MKSDSFNKRKHADNKSKESNKPNKHIKHNNEHNKHNIDKQHNNHKTISFREDLPIYKYKEQILTTIQKYQTTILVGETGTGKSTQLPQYLNTIFSNVVCTQPRRVAAITIAQKVASEQNCKIGE